ncbi:MAG: type II toxin-antitoxin system Phd/YefM family antitoxin [Propionibacteriaceae bacterium]|jgi:prevent-host-death family protein|nr:type II toxin-antitoxin system Phd/YefM family antitoxin [Propionibacteriaceae bacterium]
MVWQVQEAKQHLSEVIALAISEGEQVITKHGKPAVVVVSFDEYRRSESQAKLSYNPLVRFGPDDDPFTPGGHIDCQEFYDALSDIHEENRLRPARELPFSQWLADDEEADGENDIKGERG